MIEPHDPYQVWDGEKFRFTLNKICRIIYGSDDFTLPEKLQAIADEPVSSVAADTMPNKSGIRVVFDLGWRMTPEESYEKMAGYLAHGIIVVSNRAIMDGKKKPYPVIIVENAWEAWIEIGKYVKAVFPMPTVGITGSAGKTTTTEFARCVFNERYNTFVSGLDGKNFNSPLSIVRQWLLRAGPEYTFHAQECGGENPGIIEASARIISVDAFGITNIDTRQHIATYETAENLIADKTSFDRVRKDDTFAVINWDDEILRDFPFQSPVISFAVENESADYVGKNIVQNGPFLEFDVAGRGETTHIRINIVGKHNVYNALMVFAFAKEFGLTNEEIQRGFLEYESVGIRQNLKNVAGRLLYMDCYNASVESMELGLRTLEEIAVSSGGRRIAILGERRTSNDETYNINFSLGQSLARFSGIDEFFIVGPDEKRGVGDHKMRVNASKNGARYDTAMYDGARSVIGDGAKLFFSRDLSALAGRLRYRTKSGDAILFKGPFDLALWSIADLAFGTAYLKPSRAVFNAKKISTKYFKGDYSANFDGINLTRAVSSNDASRLVLPGMINNQPIVRIGDEAFAGNHLLKLIVFGIHVRAIGDGAFLNCTNLELLELPKNCRYIGENAFEGCGHMVRASLPGVAHISKEAFKGCAALRQVLLTEKCAAIEKDAFAGCERLIILAPDGSYAARWAEENGVRWETIDAEEELKKLAQNGTRLRSNVYGLGRFEPEAAAKAAPDQTDGDMVHISVAVAGDIMAHDELLAASLDKETGAYDFSKLFANTKQYFKSADLAIGNLETVFGPGPYTGFPAFNSPVELGEAMAQAGFDIAACANNHTLDNKCAGVVRTAKALSGMGVATAGIRDSEERKAYALVERNGVKIALINFTYLTSALGGRKVMNNRHEVDAASDKLINTFCFETLDKDLEKVKAEMESARDEGADIVLVYYHWGAEYEREAGILQKYMAYQTAKMGADAIFGSHAHVLQEMGHVSVTADGKERSVPVFYGLGNYCWSARLSRTGRETVQNGALARLDIVFDKVGRRVISIGMDYVPLYIRVDYIYNKYDVNVLSLRDMSLEETQAFNLRSSKTTSEIMEEIGQTLRGGRHSAPADLRFDTVLELPVGGRASVIGNMVSQDEFAALRSENAPVASALQNGEIIGSAPGFAGMAVTTPDGREISFVVKVTGAGVGEAPVIVDACNRVPDIYHPRDLVTGEQYGLLGGYSLRKDAAEAWRSMRQVAAEEDNIFIRCVSAYRSNEGELARIVAYEAGGDAEAGLPAPKPVGYSEHHLGMSLHVSNVQTGIKRSTMEMVSEWLEQNAYQFGFVLKTPVENQPVHLRYVGDPAAAELIYNEGIDITQYATGYPDYQEKLRAAQAWKTCYLTPEETAEPVEQWTKLTLRRICRLIGVEVPMVYRDIQDRVVPQVTMSGMDVVPGSIFFRDEKWKGFKTRTRNALRKGSVLAITKTPATNETGDKLLPQIVVEDVPAAVSAVGAFFRRQYTGKVICVVEKGEQRILRNAMHKGLEYICRVHTNMGPADNWLNVLAAVQGIPPESEVYLQNIRGAYPAYMKRMTEMLLPDVAVCAVVPNQFPKGYGQLEAYSEDYLSVLDVTLESGGMIFVNLDEPLLEQYADRPGVITFSAVNESADYCLTNSEYENGALILQIRRKGESEDFVRCLESRNVPVYGLAVCAVKDWLASHGAFDRGTWQEKDGERYCADQNGELFTGFVEKDGRLYYLSQQDGHALRDCWLDAEDKRYRLSPEDGAVLTGLHVIDGKTYYLSRGDGHMLRDCFITSGENQYHLADDGSVEKDRSITVNGKTYYLDTDGRVMRGCLVKTDGKRYYLSAKDGHVMKGGWVDAEGGKQYYLSGDDGHVISNRRGWLVRKAKKLMRKVKSVLKRG